MADSSVPITAGSGTNIDAQLPSGGDYQQTITIGDGANAGRVSAVEALGSKNALDVNLAGSAGGVANTGPTTMAAAASVQAAVANSGSGTIVMFGGSYTAMLVVFEGSADGGTNWFPIDVVRTDGSATVLTEQFAAAGVRAWNFMATGYTHVRIRSVSGTVTTGPSIIITQGPFLLDPSPSVPPVDGARYSYSSALNETSVAAAVTTSVPVWELVNPSGSGKLIRITRIAWEVTLATAGTVPLILLQKRTAASTGGTAVSQTIAKHDTLNPTVSATSKYYTAIPTVAGSSLGNPRSIRVFGVATTMTAQPNIVEWTFGNRPSQALVLRPAESVNLQGIAAFGTAPTLTGNVEWTEEAFQ